MKKLLIYLKGYIAQSILAPLFKLLEASFELIVPLVIASIIDIGIKNGDKLYIFTRSGVLVALALVGMIAAITAQYFAAKAATGFGRGLRHSLYEKIQSLSFSELDNIGTSTLITRMTNDVNQVQNGVNLVLRLLLRSPFIVIGAMVMAFFIDVKCALIFLAAIVLLSIVVFGIMAYTIPKHKNIQSKLDGVTLITRENLSGARVIRAFTGEKNEIAEFERRNTALSALQKGVGRISALLNPVTYVIINIAIVVLVYSGALRVDAGDLTQGQVVALYNYMSQILIELIKLANLIVTVTKAFASADRINSVFEQDNTLEHNRNDVQSKSFVEFDKVSLTYKNAGEKTLSDISFTADRGEVIGIIGGTGSGKSSLVSLIPHFYDATAGCVYVNGKDVKSLDDDELRGKIGYVQQKAVLFKGTVRDNMKWGKRDATDDEITEALKLAQIYDIIMDKGGLDFEIAQNGANLSGGQKQRLSVARALIRKPEILILDDSSSALDFATEARLREEIYSLSYNPTVFIVSQRASSVMSADKIIVLDDGECVGLGTHSELLKECEVYDEIYSSQFGKEDE
ncbi:MAG: ABC transporter ATP-binding protein/permease [Eubacterium sp.]|nr:ABC transporter ATP-binding protein/permease [Eubacterium sp.]MDE6767651.1 ABC transporter ATP-binding protein/permease [Eubacterium sp.]